MSLPAPLTDNAPVPLSTPESVMVAEPLPTFSVSIVVDSPATAFSSMASAHTVASSVVPIVVSPAVMLRSAVESMDAPSRLRRPPSSRRAATSEAAANWKPASSSVPLSKVLTFHISTTVAKLTLPEPSSLLKVVLTSSISEPLVALTSISWFSVWSKVVSKNCSLSSTSPCETLRVPVYLLTDLIVSCPSSPVPAFAWKSILPSPVNFSKEKIPL